MAKKKKNILILTSRTGGGHMAVANSLDQFLSERGHKTMIYDIINESSELVDSIIVDGYLFHASYAPTFYKMLYSLAETKIVDRVILTKLFSSICYKKLEELCQTFKPDVIVTTHAFHIQAIADNRAKVGCDFKIVSVVTDFRHHKGYLSPEVDAYIVGSDYSKSEMVKAGISADRIFDYGIPVKKSFLDKKSKKKANDALHILISGGSMGVSGIKSAIKQLKKSEQDIKISVICGSNERMKRRLERLTNDDERIDIYGFVDNMHEFMDQADAIVTKPGGLTTSESIVKNLPMIIPYFIPGQEGDNKDFLVKNNMAIYVKDKKRIREVVEDLVVNKDKLKKMADNMRKVSANYSIDKIIELIEK